MTKDEADELVAELKKHLPRSVFKRLCRDWQETEFNEAIEEESERTFPDLYM